MDGASEEIRGGEGGFGVVYVVTRKEVWTGQPFSMAVPG